MAILDLLSTFEKDNEKLDDLDIGNFEERIKYVDKFTDNLKNLKEYIKDKPKNNLIKELVDEIKVRCNNLISDKLEGKDIDCITEIRTLIDKRDVLKKILLDIYNIFF